MAKIDPTRKIRRAAVLITRANKGAKTYIHCTDGKYTLSARQQSNTVMVYKNGSEIAL